MLRGLEPIAGFVSFFMVKEPRDIRKVIGGVGVGLIKGIEFLVRDSIVPAEQIT